MQVVIREPAGVRSVLVDLRDEAVIILAKRCGNAAWKGETAISMRSHEGRTRHRVFGRSPITFVMSMSCSLQRSSKRTQMVAPLEFPPDQRPLGLVR